MKKKLSLGLAMALTVVIMTMGAVALSTTVLPAPEATNLPTAQPAVSQQYWSATARVELVYQLLRLGEELDTRRVSTMKQLSGEAAGRMADEILQSYYCSEPVRVPGDNQLWSYDLKAQETYLQRIYGVFRDFEQEAYLTPGPEDATLQQALTVARETIKTRFNTPPDFPENTEHYALDAAFVQLPGATEPIWRIRWWSLAHGNFYGAELSRTGEALNWTTPFTEITYTEATDLVAEGCLVTYLPGFAAGQELVAHALNTITEVGGYDENGEVISIDAQRLPFLTYETFLYYHPSIHQGWIPVWQINLYDNGSLVARQLYTCDGTYLCTAFGDRDFTKTEQDELSPAMYLASFEDAFMQNTDPAEKALMASLYRPHAEAIDKLHPGWREMDCALYEITLLQHYAIPAPTAISLEQATAIARQKAIELGADAATVNLRLCYNAYLRRDDNREVWRITVAEVDMLKAGINSIQYVSNPGYQGVYVVHVDAFTGEIVEAFEGVTDRRPCEWRY